MKPRCPTCRRSFATQRGVSLHRAQKHGWTPPHGSGSRYMNQKCRCSRCRRVWAAYLKAYRHRTGRTMPQETWERIRPKAQHGGYQMYARHGCRCTACRVGSAARRRTERERASTRAVPDHVHGSVNGYQNYSCRCRDCRSAARSRRQASRAIRDMKEHVQA